MKTALDIELQKVAAATTLCHLCTLSELEKLVAEKKAKIKNQNHEIENNESPDH